MNLIRNEPETLHIGADWARAYTINADYDFFDCTAVCKIRTVQGKLIAEVECTIEDNTVYAVLPSAKTLEISREIERAKYDVFIIGDGFEIKIIMGDMRIIHDISMH